MTAIYARQSIDKKDSISIDTQIDFCKRFVGAEQEYRIYTDKGWSGKNIERPEFQRLLSDIKRGTITKCVICVLNKIANCQWAKLEIGSIATPFSPPDPATELAKCQRYYQIRSTGDIAEVDLRPGMRATPAVTQLSDGNYAYSAEL